MRLGYFSSALMDSTYVFRKTPKGEQEVSVRSLPYAAWLTLVMIDGRSSVGKLASLQPKLPELELSLEGLLKGGYIEVASAPTAGGSFVAASIDTESPPSQENVGHPFASTRRWLRGGIILFLFLIVSASLLLLVQRSLGQFTAHIEALVALQPGKVSISSSTIVFRPHPVLRLTNVIAGRSLRVGELLARPSWRALLRGSGPISLIELREAKVASSDLLALLHPAGASRDNGVWAERVTFASSELDLGGTAISFSGELTYRADGRLKHATLSIDDGKAQVRIDDSAVELSARDWSLPTTPIVTFDQLDASGTLERTRLVLDRVGALLYDGLVKGRLILDWGVGLLTEGSLTTKNLDVTSLVGSFTRDFPVAGRLDATGDFASRAANVDDLLDQLRLKADFRVKRGVLYSADISAAAVGDARGGTTQFEDLSGHVQAAAQSLSFRDVELTSGIVSAKGYLDVAASRKIIGRFTVRLKSQGDKATTISIGGSVSEPRLRLQD